MKGIITGIILLFTFSAWGQDAVDSLVRVGIEHHDNGQYEKAITTYKAALELAPNSSRVNYELAMTYMYVKAYKKSIKYCDKVLKADDNYQLQAYTTKGSSLDYLGKTKKAIETYNTAIDKYGDNYLLYYNLGYTYYKQNDFKNADLNFIKAINEKSNHTTSHLMLGISLYKQDMRVQSLLCLYYFLFLEPNTGRSETAYSLLKEQMVGNVKKDEDNPNNISVFVDSDMPDTEFGAADIMLSMLEASNTIAENKLKSDEELFIDNTTSFFKVLGELNDDKDGLWWKFYVPFFYDVANSDHIDTFCFYIIHGQNTKADDWLSENKNRLETFSNWLKEN